MNIELRKTVLVMSATLLTLQVFLLPIRMDAETVEEQGNEQTELKEELEFPTVKDFINEESFVFTQSHMSGTVNEPLKIAFASDNEVSETKINLPKEAKLVENQLSDEISVQQDEKSDEWIIQSEKNQTSFVLPIVFESPGNYEVFVQSDKATIEITEQDDNKIDKETNQESNLEREDETSSYITSDTRESTQVSSFSEFQTAVRDNTISKIEVMSDISAPNASITQLIRDSSLLVEGNGHTINMRNNIITTQAAVVSGSTGLLEFNNIHFDSEATDATPTNIRIMEGAPSVNRWTVRFGNITTSNNITRLAINDYGRVEMYGTNNINTRYENFILSDIELDPNTTYFGNVNLVNVSVLWYRYLSRTSDSAQNRGFVIGDNSYVQLGQSQTVGTTYPAVYLNYSQLTVGQNATFNVTMPGNAVRLQVDGARMDVKSGAKVNLTSKSTSGSVVAFSRNNTTINVEPNAEFYVIGNSTRPLIDMASNDLGTAHYARTGNEFILDQPQNFDIRNLTSGTSSIAIAVAVNNTASNRFTVRNSDIDLWNVSSNPLGPSDSTFTEVQEFVVTGRGTLQNVSTTTEELQSFNQNSIRRISGMSQLPSVVWDEEVTDAHLNIKARVIVGYVPDNEGANQDGDVNYIPVYASKGQAIGTIVDSFGVEHTGLITDEEGYISYLSDKFNLAGEKIIAKDIRVGSRQSEENAETVVVDVTPPLPAKIAGEIYEDSSEINGSSEELDVSVEYTINGELAKKVDGEKITTVVDSEGKWQLPIEPGSISEGDELQIFLTDKAGNRNPIEEQELFDATFPPATKVSVLFKQIVTPVDPLDPETEVIPENKPEIPEDQGRLSLDFISQFNFGTQRISVSDQTYYAQPQRLLNEDETVNETEERPNYVQISDRRPDDERNGWQLSVTQNGQFRNENGNELIGSEIQLFNQELVTAQVVTIIPELQEEPVQQILPNTRKILLQADKESGTGTWIYRFGDQNTADKSVGLYVPKGTNPEATSYSTKLTWELSSVPDN
ncbi:WxL domain-containing protein [Enterococcus mundtii]|uniref:WxL domain-containing protein n=1 Tax=Enterococcus mundtii TaxID=53346 RepID=A0A848N0M7_ENTMU|nr:WxL domain-containing protein [Enterococcus mundtii]NMP59571.1 WxL domain-containing protein [Enterococcus mundtii]